MALTIATNEVIRPHQAPTQDCLIFTFVKDGKFSIKKAYQLLKGPQTQAGDKQFWNWMWGHKGLLPKFKLFIWRCFFNAVPVQTEIAKRIPSVSPLCKACGVEDESVTHVLFHCSFARSVWLASPLGIRSDYFIGYFSEIILSAKRAMEEKDFPTFMAIAWAVWRGRNELVYGGKKQSLKICKEYWQRAMDDSAILLHGTNAMAIWSLVKEMWKQTYLW